MPRTPHPTAPYQLTTLYSVPDDAWYLELDDLADGGRTLVVAVVPDEDPAREPHVHFDPNTGHRYIPYEVLRWFLDEVGAEIARSRDWMALRPEIVEVIKELRGEYLGAIGDEDVEPVLAGLRGTVPAADLADVMRHAFSRGADGRPLVP
ncbi:hypothetical protein [Streptomyces sp. NPDC090025]|uniref:hypothetical protein n=1 Tax=Streptomyces sp. NPDC090025 TaxID=3365922 RepID=UPI0038332BF8